ncbi:MAG: hypothetical protein COT18_01955 [Elusimicrobia bacterium CG08_land_8_20_14_0_20_59_10]|nr:MAG: hypothetical protein COT18_01955 [Elusimicrobia bacterium CG08_land_8_20_14_0_20_59_10]
MGLFGDLFSSKNGPEARAFVMKAADVFGIAGRGALVTGRVEAGAIADGDTVYFTSVTGKKLSARVKVELDQDKCPG